jgi:hypothetical protein
MTGQSSLQSWLESLANMLVGIGVGFASNLVVLPWFGVVITLRESFLSTLCFTVISLARSYMIRRFFNWLHVRQASVYGATACIRYPHQLCYLADGCKHGNCVFDSED